MEKKTLSLQTKLVAIVLLLLLIFVGGLYGLWQSLHGQLLAESAHQQEAAERLNRRLTTLESQVTALAAVPHPDAAAFDASRADIAAAQSALAQVTERVTTLEKRPTPALTLAPTATQAATTMPAVVATPLAALDAAVKKGTPYAAELDAWEKQHPTALDQTKRLHVTAATGLLTDDALRARLITLLNQTTTAAAPQDNTWIDRINTHLAGLVAIKKQGTAKPELTTIRNLSTTASIETLAATVGQLPPASQAPFAPWLDTVKARNATLAELGSLATLDGAK